MRRLFILCWIISLTSVSASGAIAPLASPMGCLRHRPIIPHALDIYLVPRIGWSISSDFGYDLKTCLPSMRDDEQPLCISYSAAVCDLKVSIDADPLKVEGHCSWGTNTERRIVFTFTSLANRQTVVSWEQADDQNRQVFGTDYECRFTNSVPSGK